MKIFNIVAFLYLVSSGHTYQPTNSQIFRRGASLQDSDIAPITILHRRKEDTQSPPSQPVAAPVAARNPSSPSHVPTDAGNMFRGSPLRVIPIDRRSDRGDTQSSADPHEASRQRGSGSGTLSSGSGSDAARSSSPSRQSGRNTDQSHGGQSPGRDNTRPDQSGTGHSSDLNGMGRQNALDVAMARAWAASRQAVAGRQASDLTRAGRSNALSGDLARAWVASRRAALRTNGHSGGHNSPSRNRPGGQ